MDSSPNTQSTLKLGGHALSVINSVQGKKPIRGQLSRSSCPVSTLLGVGPLWPLGRGPCRANPPAGCRQDGLGGACTYLKDLRAFHQPPGSLAPENKGQQPPSTRWLTVQQEAQRGAGPCLRSHSPRSLRAARSRRLLCRVGQLWQAWLRMTKRWRPRGLREAPPASPGNSRVKVGFASESVSPGVGDLNLWARGTASSMKWG